MRPPDERRVHRRHEGVDGGEPRLHRQGQGRLDLGGEAPEPGTGADTTAAAAPPDGSAANDLARITKMPGPAPVKCAVTIWLPPKTGCWLESPPSDSTSPVTLVNTGRPDLAEGQTTTSRSS